MVIKKKNNIIKQLQQLQEKESINCLPNADKYQLKKTSNSEQRIDEIKVLMHNDGQNN